MWRCPAGGYSTVKVERKWFPGALSLPLPTLFNPAVSPKLLPSKRPKVERKKGGNVRGPAFRNRRSLQDVRRTR